MSVLDPSSLDRPPLDPSLDPASPALESLVRARPLVLRTSTAERVADALREEVVEGRLRPGARLPEQAVCAALGVSRNTVREAMSQLVAERVLVREPHRGVFVTVPDRAAVRDVYRARRLIEPAAVRDGEAFDVTGLDAVHAAVREGHRAADAGRWDGVGTANQHFHRTLVALAGSPRLDQQMALLLAEMRLIFHRMTSVREFFEPYLHRNAAIAELLAAGRRVDAAAELGEYLRTAEAQLLEAYEAL